jgi:hypothetical protein
MTFFSVSLCRGLAILEKSLINLLREHVIAYYSKSLSKQQRQYCVTRRELLAIVQAVRHFHHCLYWVPFQVRTKIGLEVKACFNILKNLHIPVSI